MYDELVMALRGCVLSKPCEGCPYYDKDGPTEKCATLNIAAADAIEELIPFKKQVEKGMGLLDKADALLKAVKPRWIPVTERLPEIRQVVLITDGIDVGTGWMNQGWWNTSFADIQRDAVTHWMPLPTPPKEE